MHRQQLRAAVLILSFILMSVSFAYISPYVMMVGLQNGVIAAGLIFWILAFALTFFFGRAFCGYLCPMGAEQELIDSMIKTGLRTVPNLHLLKYLLAILWVGGAIFLAAGAGVLVLNPLYQLGNGFPPWPATTYAFFYAMAIGVFLLVLVMGRRGMCRYFCPMSVVFMAITILKNRLGIPSLHLEAEPQDCIRCKKCTTACPMSLPVQKMVEAKKMQNPECIVCGNCAGTCPKKVIRFAWFWKKY
jgi:ferredoxin-type protein NapH